MNEAQVSTAPETQNQAPEVVESQEVTTPETREETQAETPKQETAEQQEKSHEQREIERLRRALTKRDRTQGKLYQENEQLRRMVPQQQPEYEGQPAQVDPVALAEQIANLKLEIREVSNKSNKVAEEGKKRFPDFMNSVARVQEEVGPLFDQHGRASPVADALLDCEDPAGVFDYLGKHPEIAAELAELRPAQIGLRLGRIERKLSAPAEVKETAAPKPLPALKGVATGTKDPSQMSDREFAEWRKRQIAQRR